MTWSAMVGRCTLLRWCIAAPKVSMQLSVLAGVISVARALSLSLSVRRSQPFAA